MTTKCPRVAVTLNPIELEIIEILSKKSHLSKSSLIKKMVEDWLEDYEDILLARRAEEAEEEWIKGGKKTYTFEQVWNDLCT